MWVLIFYVPCVKWLWVSLFCFEGLQNWIGDLDLLRHSFFAMQPQTRVRPRIFSWELLFLLVSVLLIVRAEKRRDADATRNQSDSRSFSPLESEAAMFAVAIGNRVRLHLADPPG